MCYEVLKPSKTYRLYSLAVFISVLSHSAKVVMGVGIFKTQAVWGRSKKQNSKGHQLRTVEQKCTVK